jgi:glutaredoxin
VYGTGWCGLTFRVREYLMKARLAHEFFDIERDPKARDFVLATTDGRFPIVVIEDHVVTDPTIAELQRVVAAHAIRPGRRLSRQGASAEAIRHAQ